MTTDTAPTDYRADTRRRAGPRADAGLRTSLRILAVGLSLLLVGWGAADRGQPAGPRSPPPQRDVQRRPRRSTSTWASSPSTSSVRPTRRRCR